MQQLIRARYLLTLLLAAFPAFLPYPVSYITAAWGLVSLVIIVAQWRKVSQTQIKWFGLSILPFLLLAGYVILHPGKDAFNLLGRAHSFWIYPLCLMLFPFPYTGAQERWIKRSFVAGIFGMVLLFFAVWIVRGSHYPYTPAHDFFYRFRSEFNVCTKVHPGYAGMYAVLGILFLLEEFRLKTLSGKWVFPMIGFLAALLILLTARLPLLAGVLLTGIWIMRYYVKKRSARWTIIVSAVIVLGAIIALNSSRWSEFISLRRSGLNDVKENSLLVRLGIYQCSLGLLNQYYLTGVGPDHLQLELDRCYYRFPADVYSRQHFNTHNQYLDYWLSYGIIGLLILCTVFFIPLFIARKQDLIYMLFLLLLLICFLGENILSRQAGIVFYAFFNAMLLTQMTTKRLFDKGQKILQ